MVEAVGLRLVEPDEAEQVAGPHPGEQVGDLRRLTGPLADAGLGQQDGPFGEDPHLGDGRQERVAEGVVAFEVVPVDADPGDVGGPGPPVLDGAGTRIGHVDGPEPDHVARALLAEHGDQVPPRGHEHPGRGVPVAPGIPVAVHLGREADDHRVPVGPDLAGVGADEGVVAARGYRGQAGVTGIDLHERHRPVRVHLAGEARVEGFLPAAVVEHDVRLAADRGREVIDGLVGGGLACLGHAEVAAGRGLGRLGGIGAQDQAAGHGQDDQRHPGRDGHHGGPLHAVPALTLTVLVCQRLSCSRASA